MKKYVTNIVLVLLIFLTGCAFEVDSISVPSGIIELETATIQDLFEPIQSTIMMEGEPIYVELYPFGKLIEEDEKNYANFVIFIQSELFYVQQSYNFLRITPILGDLNAPLAFMEITQTADIAVVEAIEKIKSEINFSALASFAQFSHAPPTKDFPFDIISFLEFDENMYQDAKLIRIFIRDNLNGGVFIITTQHTLEATGGFGVRFVYFISTLKIINN